MWHNKLVLKLTAFSSRAANGLLMLLTNLLTCSKCLVISVARTMSMTACRSVRYSFLERQRQKRRVRIQTGRLQTGTRGENGVSWQCGKQHGEACEQFLHSDCSDEWTLCFLSPSEGTSTCEPFQLGIPVTLFLKCWEHTSIACTRISAIHS